MHYSIIAKVVNEYETEHAFGFNHEELTKVTEYLKSVSKTWNEDKFNNALSGITCMSGTKGIVIYPCDVITAISCATEDREMYEHEWD